MEDNLKIFKPTPARIILENALAFFFIMAIIAALQAGKFGIADFFSAVCVFCMAYLHNTYVLKPAMQKQEWLKYAIKLAICLLIIFPAFYVLSDIIYSFFNKKPFFGDSAVTYYRLAVVGSTLSVFIASGVFLFKYYAIERQMRLKAELILKNQQLLLLQSQFNPHFLFNALNSIKALTSSNPEKARHAIVQLSELLRKSLNTTTNSLIKIADELATVQEYLLLEQLRYGSRLKYEINMEPDLKSCLLPAMSVQLLVENAIKHGINKQMDGGQISINVYNKKATMVTEVRNTGQLDTNNMHAGIGVKNIVDQLKLLYNDKAGFSISNENKSTVVAQLFVPLNQD